MAREWEFIFSVFIFYGIFYYFFSISNGALVGLPSANLIISIPAQPTGNFIIDLVNGASYFITTLVSFFFILFFPFSSAAWLTPINWALLGTTVYIYLRMIRGGG